MSTPRPNRRPVGAVLASLTLSTLLLAGCGGGGGSAGGLLQGVAAAQGGSGTASQNQATNQVPNTPDSLVLVSVVPNAVSILGSGQNSTSIITVEVRDFAARPVDNICVSFTLQSGGLGGGESITPSTQAAGACTNLTVGGQASTVFRSGTIAGTVNVVAFLDANGNQAPDAGELQVVTTLSVAGGPPSGLNMGLEPTLRNVFAIQGFESTLHMISGVENDVTAFLADLFTNDVPDNTAVTFRMLDPVNLDPIGGIDGSGVTAQGTSQVVAATRSQPPVPSDGKVTAVALTQSGPASTVLSLLRDTVTPGGTSTLFAGTDGGGVWRSQDNGANWVQIGTADRGLLGSYVYDLLQLPTGEVLAATSRGVFGSLGGSVWEDRNGYQRVRNEVVAFAPCGAFFCGNLANRSASDSRLVVRVNGVRREQRSGTYNGSTLIVLFADPAGGVVSVDYDLFDRLPAGVSVTSLAQDTGGGVLYAGTLGEGVFASTTGGRTWLRRSAGLANSRVQDLAFDPRTGRLYAATQGGVFVSTAPGTATATWQAFSTGLLDNDVRALAVDGNAGDGVTRLALGTRRAGVQLATDAAFPAVLWTVPAGNPFRGLTPPDVLVSSISALSTSGQTFFVSTLDDEDPNQILGRLWSCDAAANTCAALAATGIPTRFVSSLLGQDDPATGGVDLVAGGRGRSVSRSVDAGASFADATGSVPNRITNGIYVTEDFVYSGESEVLIVEDLGRNAANGCGSGSPVAVGDCRFFRVVLSEKAFGRPVTGGCRVDVGPVDATNGPASIFFEVMPDKGYVEADFELTEFAVSMTNNNATGNPLPGGITAAVSQCDQGNGNRSVTATYTLSP